MAIPAKYAAFYLPNGSSIAFTTEACELVSGFTYKITSIFKRYWDDGETITVYENGVESVKAYTIQYPGGRIVFPSAPTTPVTVSGKYFKLEQFGGAYDFDFTPSVQLLDVTQFGDAYENVLPLFKRGVGRFDRFWFNTDISEKERVIATFYLRVPIVRALTPLTIGSFERDDDANGAANEWTKGTDGTYSLQTADPVVGQKFQRLAGGVVAAASLLWLSASGVVGQNDLVRAEIYYKTINAGGAAAVGSLKSYTAGDVEVESAEMFNITTTVSGWTRAYATMKLSDPTSVKIGIELTAEGNATLDVDYALIDVLDGGAAQVRWEGYGNIIDETDTASISDAVRQVFSIQTDGPIYLRSDEVAL